MADGLKERLRKRQTPTLASESTALSVLEKRPAKSNAERAKEHYARMKESRPGVYSAKLENQKIINERKRNYMKLEASEDEKNQAKEKHRQRMREWRRKKAMEAEDGKDSNIENAGKRRTRKDAEKEEERKKRDRERKQRERAQWSSQKKQSEKKNNRERYYAKKQQHQELVDVNDQANGVDDRTQNARRQALFRVNQVLPNDSAKKQQTIHDLLKQQHMEVSSTHEESATAVILTSSLESKEEDRAFKRLLAKKLQCIPTKSATAVSVRKLTCMKTNHVHSKAKQTIHRFKLQRRNASAVHVFNLTS